MFDYDERNTKRDEEQEKAEERDMLSSMEEGMDEEPRVDGESAEMDAEVISAEEECTEEILDAQTTEESADESFTEAPQDDSAVAAEAKEIHTEGTSPCVREYHYEEQVKKRKRARGNGWAKLIAACLVVSIAGGSAIGVSYSAAQNYFREESGTQTASTSNTESVSYLTDGLSTVDIVKKVKPSVVSISTTTTGVTQYMGRFTIPYEAEGAGSGVIFYSDDDRIAIATNNHVIDGATSIYVTLDGDKSVPAKVIGTKSESDLAVLSVSWSDLKQAGVETVTTATFGDSDSLEVGDCVIAIGNAMGMGLSATDGIVSVKEQTINVDGNSLTVLQTSAAINSGNSGGALVNTKGEVIGINTAKYNSSMAEGMGYAIPSNQITPIVEQLLETGTQPTPYIGITGTNASLYNLEVGALVLEVVEDGPAAKAGLQSGDIITVFNGKNIKDMDSLLSALEGTKVGDKVSMTIVRNNKENKTLQITIANKNQ